MYTEQQLREAFRAGQKYSDGIGVNQDAYINSLKGAVDIKVKALQDKIEWLQLNNPVDFKFAQ